MDAIVARARELGAVVREQQKVLSYQPTADGVTVHIPAAVLNQVEDTGFDWQVPGLREELAVALIKSLPKAA